MLKGELFSTDMVRALLDGRKLHTARSVKYRGRTPEQSGRDKFYKSVEALNGKLFYGAGFYKDSDVFTADGQKHVDAEYFKAKFHPGDYMYVRETWQEVFETEYDKDAVGHCVNIRTVIPNFDDIPKTCMGLSTRESCQSMQPRNRYYVYKSSNIKYADPDYVLRWRPSIHMPREASRLFYQVTKAEIMNLDDVDEQFAREDGLEADSICREISADEMDSALDKFKRFWETTYGADAKWMWVYWMEPVTKEEAWNEIM